jgi:DNA-binding transcriptional MerR regulator
MVVSQLGTKPGLVKLYLRIGEVAELVGVQPHVLRYWETEFRGAIRPQKSKKGQRVYSRQDVERLLKVKDLLRNQGFTIAGARKVLREGVSNKLEATKGEASPAAAPQAVAPAPVVSAPAVQHPVVSAPVEVSRTVTPLRPVALLSPGAAVPGVAPSASPDAASADAAWVAAPAVVWAASEENHESSTPARPAVAEPGVQTLTLSQPKPEAAAAAGLAAIAERAPMFELVLPTVAGGDRSAKRLRRALVDLRQDVVAALKELS